MYIKIKNKNNNAMYFIQWGSLLTDNFNEQVDSFDLQIKHLDSKIDIEPLDEVIIYSEDENFSDTSEVINDTIYYTRFYLVDKSQCKQITASNETKYNYSLSLVNEIKALEGIPLPSLKITQLKGTTKRTIYYYLEQYLKEYGTKIRVKINGVVSWQPKYSFSPLVEQRFNIECPEMQWNAPTLRQVFNDLMMVDDCIPTMSNGVISFIDLSEEKSQMNQTGINYVDESISSDDYINELKIELKNVMQSEQDGVNNSNEVCEYIGFRNDGVSVINTDNIQIETMNPILEIEQVIMCCPLTYFLLPSAESDEATYMYAEIDITDIVYERAEWQTLPTLFKINLTGLSSDQMGKYQNTSLYFDRQNNVISGFNTTTINFLHLAKQEQPLIYYFNRPYALKYLTQAREIDGRLVVKDAWGWSLNEIKSIMFKIKYKTTASNAMLVSKTIEPSNKRAIVDNQTNSYVDAYAQGILEYMKANRLGNRLKVINARYNNDQYAQMGQLGQTYQGSIIFKREVMYNKEFAVVNYYATDNYVLKDYFTGVKAKIRSWKIVDGSEALERHDILKYYMEFDYVAHNEDTPNKAVANYFLTPFKVGGVKLMNKNVVQFTISATTVYPSATEYYQLDFVTRISGNSILFTFGMKDNYAVAKYIDTSITDDVGGLPTQFYRYVDDNGENIGGNIYLNNEITNTGLPNQFSKITDLSALYNIQAPKPKVGYSQLGSDRLLFSWNLHKDNSEITRLTTQFEFSTNSTDIVIGSQFLKLQQCIRTIAVAQDSLNIYISDTKPNYRNVEALPSVKTLLTYKNVSITENVLTIGFTASDFELYQNKYIYICDLNNKVLLAYQYRTQNAQLVLNVLKDRNKTVYNQDGIAVENI
ncbi:MAG: hypothetical protein SPF22_00735 [Candidatus Onthovivens sp.]|nr:hypothetical protein [Candidatus Onthovivens sp.]